MISKADWLFIVLAVLIAFLFGFITGSYLERMVENYNRARFDYPSWMPRERAIRLERYHGEGHLRISVTDARIKRNGNWIIVERNYTGGSNMGFKACSKCGESFHRAMMLALLVDFGGAKCSPEPHECQEGGDHDFEYVNDKKEKDNASIRR